MSQQHNEEEDESSFVNQAQMIFVNGVEDPWQWASLRTSPASADQDQMKIFMAQCADCAH